MVPIRTVLEWYDIDVREPDKQVLTLFTNGLSGYWTGYWTGDSVSTGQRHIPRSDVRYWAVLSSLKWEKERELRYAVLSGELSSDDVYELIDTDMLGKKSVAMLDRKLRSKHGQGLTFIDACAAINLKPESRVYKVAQRIWLKRYGRE